MYIPDEKVDEVRAASDIVDVVGDYVRLKKRGSNYVGLCPFHNEKTPSFNVNPGMGIFKCFGCGQGGNVFQFLMQVERIGFPEAVRMLAEKAGIPLPEADAQPEQASEAEALYHALRFAARFFYEQLTQTEGGRPARDYLLGRGFTPQTIKRFGLGYAPDRWDALRRAAEANHIPPDILEKAGLVIARKDGSDYYDRYRGRVIFPIFSHVGKVVGFGGRILVSSADQPKYINSPETPVYSKSRVLYGLHQGKQAIRREEEVILVEGYTDVISLQQAGVEHVVAVCGTSLTEGHLKVLARYAKRIVFLNDSDAAGDRSTVRGINMALREGLMPQVVELPDKEDPDSFVQRHGRQAFEEFVKKYRWSFVQFMLIRARQDGRLLDPESEVSALNEVLESIAQIPNPLGRDAYVHEMSDILDKPDIQLYSVLEKILLAQRRKEDWKAQRGPAAAPEPARPPESGPAVSAVQAQPAGIAPEAAGRRRTLLPEEKTLIRLMLEHGRLMVEFVLGRMGLDEFSEGPSREAAACFLQLYEEGVVDKQRFLDGSFSPAVQRLAAEVLMDPYEPSENWERRQGIPVPRLNEDPYEAAASAMMLLKLDRVNEAIEAQREKIFRAAQGSADLRPLQEEMMALHNLRKRIEQRAFLEWDNV